MKNLLFMMAAAGGAMAASPALADRTPMSDVQLGEHRAGFMTPLGIEIGLGAEVRTYVDGDLALESRLTWTQDGLIREVVSGQETPDAQQVAAQFGIDLPGEWSGLVIEHEDGVSAALSSIGDQRIASVLTNSASDQDLRMETEFNVYVPDLTAVQQQFLQDQAQMSLQDIVSSAIRDSAMP